MRGQAAAPAVAERVRRMKDAGIISGTASSSELRSSFR